ncbi:late control protein D [Salmonella enterica subsp. enterica serovar Typhi]|nr:late control protein D [Salmonella enterica subsp. enterica serovar Typhi]
MLDNRLMSLTLTDNRGFEADQLDLELDDADGKIVLPRRGLSLRWRWAGRGSRFSRKEHSRWTRLNTLAHRTA